MTPRPTYDDIATVLRPLVAVTDIFASTPTSDHERHILEIGLNDLWPLRDLLSRLEAQSWAQETEIEITNELEGGGCHRTLGETRAVHVAPPASGSSSGRAITEGWAWPANSRKAHYFVGSRSLCARLMFLGRIDPADQQSTSSADCQTCAKRLAKGRRPSRPREDGGRPVSALSELRERIERSSGPDRELDCLIWAEFDNRDVRWDGSRLLARSRKPPHDECWLGWIDPGRYQRNFRVCNGFDPPIPDFTASIDAALALVERKLPGWTYVLDNGSSAPLSLASLYSPQWPNGPSADGKEAYSMPLAVLSAFLRALESQEQDGG